eukprot:371731-Prorocentrum_minimum.AAC.2
MDDDDKRKYEEMLDKPKTATEAAVASVLKEADEAKKAKRVRFEEGKAPLFPDAKGKAPMVEMDTEEDGGKDEGPIMEVRRTAFKLRHLFKSMGVRVSLVV